MPSNLPTPAACQLAEAVPRNRFGRMALIAIATLLGVATAAFGAPAAFAAPSQFNGASAGGDVVAFTTTDQLVDGDYDAFRDIYVRSRDPELGVYVTREASVGPNRGNAPYDAQFDAISSDGSRVFFSTVESLVEEDKDRSSDVYVRNLATNTTELVSRGEAACAGEGCGNGEFDAAFVPGGMAAGGDRIFFATTEKLSPEDGDTALDVYMRDLSAGTTTLVSRGAASCAGEGCGNGSAGALFKQASESGEKVVFTTTEALSSEDTDTSLDIYQRDIGAGTTRLVSPTTGSCPEGVNCNPTFRGAATDGSHVFFESSDRIVGEDTDGVQDVYDWSGGTGAVSLASIGAEGAGNGAYDVTYAGNSADGATAYFETSEPLDPSADTDVARDVYARSGGATTLVSTGAEGEGGNGLEAATLDWVSPDGSTAAVFFSTAESLSSEDTDTSQDVYERSGGTTTLISTGPEPVAPDRNASFVDASVDGSLAFFVTSQSLVEADGDPEQKDVYARSTGASPATSLVSTVEGGGNGSHEANLVGMSSDGLHAFFSTQERLSPDDLNSELDVYQRYAGETELISGGNGELRLGPSPPSLASTTPGSPGESTTPSVVGHADSGTAITIFASGDCSGEPARAPGGGAAGGSAAQLASPGIAIAVEGGSTTMFSAFAENPSTGDRSECSNSISYAQYTPPAEEGGEEGSGGGEEGGGGEGGPGGQSGAGGGGATGGETATAPVASPSPAPTYGPSAKPFVTPVARITFGPSFKTRKRRPVFRFADVTGQPGTKFICKVDRRRWHNCGSPAKLRKLGRGRHVFHVKAVNALGVWQAAQVRRAFKVVAGGRRHLRRHHLRHRRVRRPAARRHG